MAIKVIFELALGCVARFAAGNFRQPIAAPSKEQLTAKNVFADGGGIATPAVDTNSRAEALSCHDQSLACFVQNPWGFERSPRGRLSSNEPPTNPARFITSEISLMLFCHGVRRRQIWSGKYPPAKPGALGREPLEAAGGVADAAP